MTGVEMSEGITARNVCKRFARDGEWLDVSRG